MCKKEFENSNTIKIMIGRRYQMNGLKCDSMKKTKICIIGHFAWKDNDMIGAVVKARSLYSQLTAEYENEKGINTIDIYMWRKNKFKVFYQLVRGFALSKNIILVISESSGKILSLIKLLKHIFNNNILYCLVGGDLDTNLKNHPERIKNIRCINHFFVETERCRSGLVDLGISNVSVLKNFKMLQPVKNIKEQNYESFKFCCFSRIVKEKGIEDAIKAIDILNKAGYKCILDIYGAVDSSYNKEFFDIINGNEQCEYKGCVEANQSVEVLSDYFCLLFPTRFFNEGIPGTIIDGFAAGIPIICSDWKYRTELIVDGENGLVYPFLDFEGLIEKMKYAMLHSDRMEYIRYNSLKSYMNYNPSEVIGILKEYVV